MVGGGRTSVLFVMPPGGITSHFSEHIGTAFLRTMLARAGIRSQQYLPERNASLPAFARFLDEHRPAIVGFTAYESNLKSCRAMARVVRESLPEAIVVVGGPNATFSPEETLALLVADLGVRGAGEGTVVAIVQAILGADSPRRRLPELLAEIPNLVIRTRGGTVRTRQGEISSFPSEHFRCLDDIPSPYQHGLIMTADVGYLTARGCNQHCTYCSFVAMSARQVRHHSVERVLDDLAALKAVFDRVERRRASLLISDDAFTLAPERARAICEGIVRRGLQMPFECETRADRVDASLLRLMKDAGFTGVSFGLESAVPSVLRAIGKVQEPTTCDDPGFERERAFLEAFRRAIADARKAGLSPSVSIIGGLPGETVDDFRATLAFVESLEVSRYAHNVLTLLPGTPLHRDRVRHGLQAGRDEVTGSWRTTHTFDVMSVPPLKGSTVHLVRRDEATQASDALCGRPRSDRASDDAAWAVVLHVPPDPAVAAWLAEVLAVHGAVVVESTAGRSEHAAWLRLLNEATVPWGFFATLSREDGAGVVLRSLGTLGEHRFVIEPAWPANGDGIEVDDAGHWRVPVWIASGAASPPPAARTPELLALTPQIADGCRWWSGWPRCGHPGVLHLWPGGRVTACWRGPALGRMGDAHSELVARGKALTRGAEGAAADRCPLAGGADLTREAASTAERYEVASQLSWLFRQEADTR